MFSLIAGSQKISRRFSIRQYLKIQPGEEFRVILMFAYSFAAVGGGIVLGRMISRSLFLSLLPETAVPYKFILPPFFVVAGTLAYNRLVPRYYTYRLIAATNLLAISGLLIFRYFLDSSFSTNFTFLAILYIYFEIVVTTIGIQFWTFAGEIFNPREAKRLFGLIAAGGVLSNAVAGFLLQAVSKSILPKDLIIFMALSILVGILCVWILGKQNKKKASVAPRSLIRQSETVPVSARKDFREILSQPMLITIAWLMIFTSLITNISDFQLDLSLQRFYGHDGQAILKFLGLFQVYVGIAAFAVQILLTNRVLQRYGIAAGLLLLPLAIGGSSFAFVLSSGAFWAMALPRGMDMTLRYTINDASINALFLPIREDLRKRIKSILDGIIKPPVTALLGLTFLLFLRKDIDQLGVQASDVVPWSIAALGLTAIWAVVAFRSRKRYETALVESLRSHRFGIGNASYDIKDEITAGLIGRELQNELSNPLRVINIVEILKSSEGIDWNPYIIPLLNHKVGKVRQLAIEYFEQHTMISDGSNVSKLLSDLFNDEDAYVRNAAIKAYCAQMGDLSIPDIRFALTGSDLGARQSAIIGLMNYAGASGVKDASPILDQLLISVDPKEREAGAAILGNIPLQNYYKSILNLLNDPDDNVQKQAILSIETAKNLLFVPLLIEKLGNPKLAFRVRKALAGYGVEIIPQLAEVLAGDSSISKKVEIVKALREIYALESSNVLSKYFDDPNDHLRASVAKALAHLQRNGIQPEIPRSEILRAALGEIELTYSIHVQQADIAREVSGAAILSRVLHDRRKFIIDHLFSLLTLLYTDLDINLVYKTIVSGTERKSLAIELIDAMTEREIRDVMLPLIEAPEELILQIAKSRFGLQPMDAETRLTMLAQSPDPVLRAFAIRQMGLLDLNSISNVIDQNLDYDHELVQEAVVWAAAFAAPDNDVHRFLKKQTESKFKTVQKYAKRLLKEAGE